MSVQTHETSSKTFQLPFSKTLPSSVGIPILSPHRPFQQLTAFVINDVNKMVQRTYHVQHFARITLKEFWVSYMC